MGTGDVPDKYQLSSVCPTDDGFVRPSNKRNTAWQLRTPDLPSSIERKAATIPSESIPGRVLSKRFEEWCGYEKHSGERAFGGFGWRDDNAKLGAANRAPDGSESATGKACGEGDAIRAIAIWIAGDREQVGGSAATTGLTVPLCCYA